MTMRTHAHKMDNWIWHCCQIVWLPPSIQCTHWKGTLGGNAQRLKGGQGWGWVMRSKMRTCIENGTRIYISVSFANHRLDSTRLGLHPIPSWSIRREPHRTSTGRRTNGDNELLRYIDADFMCSAVCSIVCALYWGCRNCKQIWITSSALLKLCRFGRKSNGNLTFPCLAQSLSGST